MEEGKANKIWQTEVWSNKCTMIHRVRSLALMPPKCYGIFFWAIAASTGKLVMGQNPDHKGAPL